MPYSVPTIKCAARFSSRVVNKGDPCSYLRRPCFGAVVWSRFYFREIPIIGLKPTPPPECVRSYYQITNKSTYLLYLLPEPSNTWMTRTLPLERQVRLGRRSRSIATIRGGVISLDPLYGHGAVDRNALPW
jgi:hypothetical protein